MTTDYRALCAELADALDHNRQCLMDDRSLTHPLADRARAVLARYGRQPASPAEGEVAELVARLRRASDGASAMGWEQDSWIIARAADLLAQRHPAPVPVSERLPGVGDCLGRPTEESDAGWCWTYSDVPETWSFESVVFPRPYPDPPLVRLKPSVTHWLPHYALPLPSGEVQP